MRVVGGRVHFSTVGDNVVKIGPTIAVVWKRKNDEVGEIRRCAREQVTFRVKGVVVLSNSRPPSLFLLCGKWER
jgi:hypothetical protein